jgi:uncharacterized protein
VKYWDSSALVPLCVDEASSPHMREIYRADPGLVTWWGSEIECVSALARLEREGAMSADMVSAAVARRKSLGSAWHEVQPSQVLRDTAVRLLRVHPLRGADAVQLASAVVAADGEPSSIELVTMDTRLTAAARREGFTVLGQS